MRLIPFRVAAALLAGALLAPLSAAIAPAPASAYPASEIQFEGHGWGHGRGMGQYGSFGYAVDQSQAYSWILDHYYGGTTKGSRADEEITVRLIEHDGKDLIVTSRAPFTIAATTFAAGQAGRIRRNAATGSWFIEKASSCAGPWNVAQEITTTPEAKSVTVTGDDVNLMLSICGKDTRAYRGYLRVLFVEGMTRAINVVRMEQYLRGVVPRESIPSWGSAGGGKGMNALRVQAVAARSYAWAENRSFGNWKTCDTTSCQVYGGAGLNGVRIEVASTDQAVADTAGEVRIGSNGQAARTEFSSSTGGYTAGGTFPAVPDDGDGTSSNPNHDWSGRVGVDKVTAAYPSLGTLQKVEVVNRNGLGREGGRASSVKLTGDKGTMTITGDQLRSKLGLKSDWYRVIDPRLNAPAIGLSATHATEGFVLTSTAGEAMAAGSASTYGSMEGIALAKPVVGIATTPTDKGYWLAASDGAVFAFGDAPALGSLAGTKLYSPIVGIAASPTGKGFWLASADGSVFAYGDAKFKGSMGGKRLVKPIVGIAAHPTGLGYYLVATDGGIFTFGTAKFRGSTGNIVLNQPIVGMAVDPLARGYWFVAADGGVFSFPSGLHQGPFRTLPPVSAPIVGMAATPTGAGYWLVGRDGAIYRYGDAS